MAPIFGSPCYNPHCMYSYSL